MMVGLPIEIYNSLKETKDYGFRDKIHQATVSIPSNIFEGYDRKGNKEFIQFICKAKSSCSELRIQLYIAKDS